MKKVIRFGVIGAGSIAVKHLDVIKSIAGIKIEGNDFVSETLVTHKNSGLKKIIKLKQNL